ncbi:MAG TPA: glycosyltransferase family 4 protein [Bryobacteraceae bacterium]|jgi:glycosyltransferase involved in cell wall biosynthesis|nr:glycosyltransferase family 4 protein [Bryobacteraceae bacterium]
MKPRILMALPQLPQDPASGAARTAQTALEMAAEAGFEVHVLATTATERGHRDDPLAYLRSLDLDVAVQAPTGSSGREYRFVQRGIPYTLLDTGRFPFTRWEPTHGRKFDRLFDRELEEFTPDLVFTYGGNPGDVRRHRRAHLAHAQVACCVFNFGYLTPHFFDSVDSVLTPSEFLARYYRDAIGVESTPLPTPLEWDDVVAAEHDPIFVTMVNPSIEKGLFFFARLAEEIGKRHPEIALLAIESRGTAGMVFEAGLRGGFDLRRHQNIMIGGAVPKPRDIFENTRVLLAPSVWEEPSGRVVAEALANGVPPVVSDRGGLAESANGAGMVLPLPPDLTRETRKPVSAAAVEPWIDAIVKLCFDEAFYGKMVESARNAAGIYRREKLAPRYVDFFRAALAGPRRG